MCTNQLLFPRMVATVLVSRWLVFEGKRSWHFWQLRMRLSIALSIPGPYTVSLALCLVLTDPWCDSCSCDSTSFRIWVGINKRQSDCHPKWGTAWHFSTFYIALAVSCDGWGILWEWTFWASGILHLVLLLCKGGLGVFVLCCDWCVPLFLQWIFLGCCWCQLQQGFLLVVDQRLDFEREHLVH